MILGLGSDLSDIRRVQASLDRFVAVKVLARHLALEPGFVEYQRQIVANARRLAENLAAAGFRLVSGGTDNHLMLVDVFSKGLTGKVAEAALGKAGITVNKNTIPFDTNSPMVASGIRIGTPAVTTRGMTETEMELVGELIVRALATPLEGKGLDNVPEGIAYPDHGHEAAHPDHAQAPANVIEEVKSPTRTYPRVPRSMTRVPPPTSSGSARTSSRLAPTSLPRPSTPP